MITTAAEYYSKLYDIQQSSSLKNDLRIPSWDYIKSYDGFSSKEKYYTDEKGTEEIKLTKETYEVGKYFIKNPNPEPIYEINLNTRTIKAPNYLSVAKDHFAETVYFKCDKIFEDVDLTTKVGVVQYINANNEGGLYVIPFYDDKAIPGKIVFPWYISGKATEVAGDVKFSFVFYSIDENRNFDYKLNTQPATSKVLYGMDLAEEIEEKYEINASLLDEINLRLKEYGDQAELRWLDLTEIGIPDTDSPVTESDYRVIQTIIGEKN